MFALHSLPMTEREPDDTRPSTATDRTDPVAGEPDDPHFRTVLERAADCTDAAFAAGLVTGADTIRVADDPDTALENVRRDLTYITDEHRAAGHIQGAIHYHRLVTAPDTTTP